MDQIALLAAALAAVVMFSLGLDLTLADFFGVFRHPRALALGLINQFLILPGITLFACWMWPVEPSLLVGFMVVAACPGSVPSNLMTQLARGNRALSVSLTAITSALCFLTLPAAIAIAVAVSSGSHRPSGLPILANATKVLLISGVPLTLGMFFRRVRPGSARSLARVFPPFCLLAVLAIIGATVWFERHQVAASLVNVGGRALMLNLLTLTSSFLIAWFAGISRESRIALCMECSLHNAAMGMYVCVTLLGDRVSVMPTLAYGLIMWGTATVFVLIARRGIISQPREISAIRATPPATPT